MDIKHHDKYGEEREDLFSLALGRGRAILKGRNFDLGG
jgi:hypothetical protein